MTETAILSVSEPQRPPDGARSVIADILHALARRGDVQWWEAQALRDAAHLLLLAAAEEDTDA